MKSSIKAALLGCALALALSALLPTASYAQDAVIEGTSYYLPKTALQFTFLIEKKTFTPGEYADYAISYLKHSEAVLDAKTSYRILNIDAKAIGVADTAKYHTAKISPKLSIHKIFTNSDGMLRSVNVEPKPIPADKHFTPAKKPQPLRPRDYMSEEILSAGSKSKMAQLCAEEIYEIRSSRNELTRGTAETLPKDGEQLRLMLNTLNTQEKALLQLFEGITNCDTIETVITIQPEREVNNRILFRFSEAFGMVGADDLSGAPYYLTISDLHQTPEDTRTDKEKLKDKDETGLFINVPGRARIKIYKEEKLVKEFDTPFAQFGRSENLSPLLFTKKVSTSYEINPVSGAIINLHSEELAK